MEWRLVSFYSVYSPYRCCYVGTQKANEQQAHALSHRISLESTLYIISYQEKNMIPKSSPSHEYICMYQKFLNRYEKTYKRVSRCLNMYRCCISFSVFFFVFFFLFKDFLYIISRKQKVPQPIGENTAQANKKVPLSCSF